MKLYRIYTEDKNRERLIALTNKYFDGATLQPAVGIWKGQQEGSFIIEIVTYNWWCVGMLAEDVKRENRQESVLVTAQDLQMELI